MRIFQPSFWLAGSCATGTCQSDARLKILAKQTNIDFNMEIS